PVRPRGLRRPDVDRARHQRLAVVPGLLGRELRDGDHPLRRGLLQRVREQVGPQPLTTGSPRLEPDGVVESGAMPDHPEATLAALEALVDTLAPQTDAGP